MQNIGQAYSGVPRMEQINQPFHRLKCTRTIPQSLRKKLGPVFEGLESTCMGSARNNGMPTPRMIACVKKCRMTLPTPFTQAPLPTELGSQQKKIATAQTGQEAYYQASSRGTQKAAHVLFHLTWYLEPGSVWKSIQLLNPVGSSRLLWICRRKDAIFLLLLLHDRSNKRSELQKFWSLPRNGGYKRVFEISPSKIPLFC